MSAPPLPIRRADLAMDEERTHLALSKGYAGRLATVGPDGWPYVVPLLYVWKSGVIYVHNSSTPGHLRTNVENNSRVMAFGAIRIVDSDDEKAGFCDALMEKYAADVSGRPKRFYPRLDHITVYAIQVERLTGKEIKLPPASAQWPELDRTKSPNAPSPSADR